VLKGVLFRGTKVENARKEIRRRGESSHETNYQPADILSRREYCNAQDGPEKIGRQIVLYSANSSCH
jgi:hypothetical protein